MSARRTIVLYGDVNLNIMDGSAIWLVSLAETLSLTDSEIHLVLKAHVETDRLLTRLHDNPRVTIHQARPKRGLSEMGLTQAISEVEEVVGNTGADIVIMRGRRLCLEAAQSAVLSPVLWSYVTDYTFPATEVSATQLAQLSKIAAGSRRVFMQTEDSRSYFESLVPEASGKTLLMTPTIPDDFFASGDRVPGTRLLRMVYAGKFHPAWHTLEMLELPARLAEAGVASTLTVIGDKVMERGTSGWGEAMRQGLSTPPVDVSWLGGLPREQAVQAIAASDIGISWRDSSLDSSLEISTKMLEYCATGTPPVLNRSRAHEQLLGADYPLFLDDDRPETVVDVLVRAAGRLSEIREAARAAARPYSVSASAERLEGYFRRAEADYTTFPPKNERLRVLVASHDLKFAGELIDLLRSRPDIELRIDNWEALAKHDEEASQKLLDWAQLVICEWAGPNAVWYSQRVRDDQRLIVRLHMFELKAPWIHDIVIDNVDAVVTVSDYYHDLVLYELPWAPEKVHSIPNGIDVVDLARPKAPSARHTLALVGMVPFRKRPDRALDLLEELLTRDPRFRLAFRGRKPWEYPWVWRKPEEQEPYIRFFERIGNSPVLLERVTFSPFGPDMGSWLRDIGWVLSPSDDESFHLAPAEGMASGSLATFWPRDGVDRIFGTHFIFDSLTEMADFIVSTTNDESAWVREESVARQISAQFDSAVVNRSWLRLILG